MIALDQRGVLFTLLGFLDRHFIFHSFPANLAAIKETRRGDREGGREAGGVGG